MVWSTDFDKNCDQYNGDEKKEELLKVPRAPQHPLLQAHH